MDTQIENSENSNIVHSVKSKHENTNPSISDQIADAQIQTSSLLSNLDSFLVDLEKDNMAIEKNLNECETDAEKENLRQGILPMTINMVENTRNEIPATQDPEGDFRIEYDVKYGVFPDSDGSKPDITYK